MRESKDEPSIFSDLNSVALEDKKKRKGVVEFHLNGNGKHKSRVFTKEHKTATDSSV